MKKNKKNKAVVSSWENIESETESTKPGPASTEPEPASSEPEPKPISILPDINEMNSRKSSFLKAIQSDRIMVLVGPSQMSFQVPQDLLTQWSSPLGKMCQSEFLESSTRLIRLPHVKISTFEDFFIWMHTYEPSVNKQSFMSTLNLAIFAEMYIICHLKNQTSDVLRAELGSGRWQLRPDDVSMVYDEVPSGSILRELCSVSLALPTQKNPPISNWGYSTSSRNDPNFVNAHKQHDKYLDWEPVFQKHSDLGWDYFKQIQTSHAQIAINSGGPCRFHDHRDVPGTKRDAVDKCPYPRGVLPAERSPQSLPNGHQCGIDQLATNGKEKEAQVILDEQSTVFEDH